MSLKLKYRIALEVGKGIHAMHTQTFPPLVHRDLRSPNVFVRSISTPLQLHLILLQLLSLSDDAPIVAKVGDFGLTRQAAPQLTDIMSTWQWVGPEVMDAINPRYDERSDVFSYGIVFSEILNRALPYSEYEEYLLKKKETLTDEQVLFLPSCSSHLFSSPTPP